MKKVWKGFVIAKDQGDEDKMRYYAKGIQKFQKQLGLVVRPFPDLGLWDVERDDTIDDDENQDDPYRYESEAQRIWRKRIEQPYESQAQRVWREKMERFY